MMKTVVMRNVFEQNDVLICFGDRHVPYIDSMVKKIMAYVAHCNVQVEYIDELYMFIIYCNTLKQMNKMADVLATWIENSTIVSVVSNNNVSEVIPEIE